MRHSIGDHLRHRSESIKSRSSTEEVRDTGLEDTTVVEPDQGNVLSHIISQLRPGADLSRVTLPTFILEERSMLERITNFMAHPDTLLPMSAIDDPLERFVAVVKYYLSGWHIRPPGVKKPLNPILGETFTGYWEYPDGTRGYYIAEQTSHHPPKSSYFFIAPDHQVRIDGCLKPRSRFLGNSAASLMEGVSYLRLTNRGSSPGGEKYVLTQPNMYARGILFGKMKYELGDHATIRCPDNHLSADIEFKTKGWVGGTYNAIGGWIKDDETGEHLYELSGLWTGEMYAKEVKTGHKILLFDATHARHAPPLARPYDEQGERESQRLWRDVCKAVHVMDHEKATTEKSKIEDRQREEAKRREENGETWSPKLFRRIDPSADEDDLEWVIDADIPTNADPQSITKQVLAIADIVPGQRSNDKTTPSSGTEKRESGAAGNLIDLDEPPAQKSEVPPSTGSITTATINSPSESLQPTMAHSQAPNHNSSSTAPPSQGKSLDDNTGLGSKLNNMKISDPSPGVNASTSTSTNASRPIQRTDTETSEVDVFVDAEG